MTRAVAVGLGVGVVVGSGGWLLGWSLWTTEIVGVGVCFAVLLPGFVQALREARRDRQAAR